MPRSRTDNFLSLFLLEIGRSVGLNKKYRTGLNTRENLLVQRLRERGTGQTRTSKLQKLLWQENQGFSSKKNSKSRTAVAFFALPIADRYRLTADELSWRIEKCKGKRWIAIQWHSDIEEAVHSLAHDSDVGSANPSRHALVAVENVSRTLTHALAPHFRVEWRS